MWKGDSCLKKYALIAMESLNNGGDMTKDMTNYSYKDMRWQDPRWLTFANNLKSKRGWRCEDCGYQGSYLKVHHLDYSKDKRRELWDYDESLLKVLCYDCHDIRHNIRRIADEQCAPREESAPSQIKKKGPSPYTSKVYSRVLPEQLEILESVRNDIRGVCNRRANLSDALRYLLVLVKSEYIKNKNWIKDLEITYGFIKENGSQIW